MAMSLPHPDPGSPAAVADASFGTARRGFDQGQVRDFLRMVAAELGRMQERERFLERELRVAQSNPDLDPSSLDDATLTRLLGEETARVLGTARESAREIREKAEESAARMLAEASEEVARIREQADLDAARLRADATADAESEIEMAKQQGREMVTEARAYRERVLSELARRRELAREQIEQLIHGRDRLIQAFERARLAAVDVVSELEPLGEPSEYVNLTPTTGPVPVMVPNARPEPTEATQALPRTLDPAADAAEGDEAAEGDDAEDAAADSRPDADDDAPIDAADETAAPDATTTDELSDVADPTDDRDAAEPAEPTAASEPADADESVELDGHADAERAETDAPDATTDVDAEVADDPAAVGAEETDDPDAAPDEERVDGAADVEDDTTAHEEVADGTDDAAIETEAPAEGADEERDDVVVDLFARLRAGSSEAPTEDLVDDTDLTADNDAADNTTDDNDDTADNDDTSGADESAAASATVVGDIGTSGADDAEADDDTVVDTPFSVRDAELTPLIVASARKLKRVLADEQNGVLEVLRGDAGVVALDELVPSSSDQSAAYAGSIEAELGEAALAGARSIGGDGQRLAAREAKAARSAAATVVTEWLVQPLRDRLERCVDEGDGDNTVISRRVRSVYREWKTQHIDEQLDDVLRTAYGRGALGAADASTQLVWVVDSAHPACPDCDDNSLSPPVVAGEEFPTGHTFAPAHPGCRCLLTVVDR